MSQLVFRKLRPDEIECRIGQIKREGLSLLLYKDARCDMNILDETVGTLDWKREHTRDNANCTVSIWDSKKNQWVGKEDVGTESNTEAQKGLASDSFKRACVNWGIGRELYSAPFIWIKAGDANIQELGGKIRCFDKFEVAKLTYKKNGDIDALAIVNSKSKKVVFVQMPTEKEEVEKKDDGDPDRAYEVRREVEAEAHEDYVRSQAPEFRV